MSPDLTDVLGSVLPVLLLIGLGVLLRTLGVLTDATVSGLKQLIVSVSLPAVLFTTFLTTTFAPEHGWVVGTVVTVCLALFGLGHVFRRVTGGSPYAPFLFTGFELGMLGFALFAAVYGSDQLPALGVLALGHELFIWFVFVTLLRATAHRRQSVGRTVLSLVTSPVIVAILLGLVLNAAGLGDLLSRGAFGTAIGTTLKYLAAVIVPLVLIIVGYGSRLTLRGVRQALPLVASRLVVVVVLAVLIGRLVFVGLLGLPMIYAHAAFTLMVLPPPYIVPLFIPPGRRADLEYCNNVLSLYSLATVAVFVSYVVLGSS